MRGTAGAGGVGRAGTGRSGACACRKALRVGLASLPAASKSVPACPFCSRARLRAAESPDFGHGTAFWHRLGTFQRRVCSVDFADLGFFCERSSFSVGKRRIPCQNAVPWPKIRISAAWGNLADAFSSVSFASGVLAARAPLRRAPRAHAAASTVVAWRRVRASFEGRCVFRPAPVEFSPLWIRALSRASHPGTFKAAKGWAMPHRMRGVADGCPFPIASGT